MDTPVHVLFWDFFNPNRLWAAFLAPLLFLAYLILLRLKRNKGMRYTQVGVLAAVLPRQSRWRRHISVVMALCSIVTIAGAWARPVGVERVPRERATIVMVLDVSMSMQATDVQPSRLEASKQAASTFINEVPEKYNIAIVTMSGSASVISPPTTDRQVTQRVIDSLELAEGTAVGDALSAAVSAAQMAPGDDESEEPPPASIVLLSDGKETGGSLTAQEGAQKAKDKKIPVYTIAFGTQNGYVDMDGQRYNVAPDRDMMRSIAETTGGETMDATSVDQLDKVYESMKSEVGYEDVKKEVTSRWALYAAAFAVIASVGAVSMAARWP